MEAVRNSNSARNPAEIASGLARLRTEEVSIDLERLRIFSWSTQTEKLKRFSQAFCSQTSF